MKNNIDIYLKLNEAGLVEQLQEFQWNFQENCDLWQYQKSYKRALVSLLKRHLWKNHRRSNWPPSLFRVNVLNVIWKWTCNGEILTNIAFSIEPMISTHNCSIKWNECLNMYLDININENFYCGKWPFKKFHRQMFAEGSLCWGSLAYHTFKS